MKMLEQIEDFELERLLKAIRKKRLAGYQENIVERYVEEEKWNHFLMK